MEEKIFKDELLEFKSFYLEGKYEEKAKLPRQQNLLLKEVKYFLGAFSLFSLVIILRLMILTSISLSTSVSLLLRNTPVFFLIVSYFFSKGIQNSVKVHFLELFNLNFLLPNLTVFTFSTIMSQLHFRLTLQKEMGNLANDTSNQLTDFSDYSSYLITNISNISRFLLILFIKDSINNLIKLINSTLLVFVFKVILFLNSSISLNEVWIELMSSLVNLIIFYYYIKYKKIKFYHKHCIAIEKIKMLSLKNSCRKLKASEDHDNFEEIMEILNISNVGIAVLNLEQKETPQLKINKAVMEILMEISVNHDSKEGR